MSTKAPNLESPFGGIESKTSADAGIDVVDVLNLLGCQTRHSTERRWTTLQHVAKEECIAKRELVERVAQDEMDDDGPVSGDVRSRVRASLTQTHLPALEDADVIVETQAGIELGPAADPIISRMESTQSSLFDAVCARVSSLF